MARATDDPWRYFAITHATHDIMNPLSSAKLDRVVERLALKRGAHVVDIACGKGEFLVRVALYYRGSGTGVDLSPYNIKDAEARALRRGLREALRFREMDGRDYRPLRGESFAAASCLGATWVFGGLSGTLDALKGLAAPRGIVAVGHPFWRRQPPKRYLALERINTSEYSSREHDIALGERKGLEFVDAVLSSRADFDEYEGKQWRAAADHAAANPEDPQLLEIRKRVARSKQAYLAGGRESLGWGVYIFQKKR